MWSKIYLNELFTLQKYGVFDLNVRMVLIVLSLLLMSIKQYIRLITCTNILIKTFASSLNFNLCKIQLLSKSVKSIHKVITIYFTDHNLTIDTSKGSMTKENDCRQKQPRSIFLILISIILRVENSLKRTSENPSQIPLRKSGAASSSSAMWW